jgi:hypothetical protein
MSGISELLMWLGGQVVVAASVWGAIRADIRSIHTRLDRLERRIDNHLDYERT